MVDCRLASDGVNAPARRHRDVPMWRCCNSHDEGEGVQGTGNHHRDRSGEAELSGARRVRGWIGILSQESQSREAAWLPGLAPEQRGGDGGVCERQLLGTGDLRTRS